MLVGVVYLWVTRWIAKLLSFTASTEACLDLIQAVAGCQFGRHGPSTSNQ